MSFDEHMPAIAQPTNICQDPFIMENVTVEQKIAQIEERVNVLERAVFDRGDRFVAPSAGVRNKSGPTRAITELVANSYFSGKRTLGDVRAALEEKGYFYSAQAVDISLSRLSRRDGPLVSLRVAGRKVYAERR